jgi:hypothetical protein
LRAFLDLGAPNALFTLLNGWEDTMAYIKVATEHPEIAERASTFVAAANQVTPSPPLSLWVDVA